MDEYVALEWTTECSKHDTTFMVERRQMLDQGWTESLRASWPSQRKPKPLTGGICIMRRPKDEPQEKPERADYEYVALESEWGLSESQEKLLCFNRNELIRLGWKEWIRIRWYGSQAGHVRVFRRELRRPKDEPRMWTEGEIRGLMDEVHRRRAARFEEATRPAEVTIDKVTHCA